MKRVGKYFLPNLLTVSLSFCMFGGLMDHKELAINLKGAQQEKMSEMAASDFDPELDVMNEDTVQELNEMLEEEEAGRLITVVGSGMDVSRNTSSQKASTTAMAGMAFVTESLENKELNDYAVELLTDAGAEDSGAEDEEAAETEEVEEVEEWTSFEKLFAGKLMANPEKLTAEALNVRQTPTTNAAVVGKLYPNAWAEVIAASENGEWIQIQSGNVSGWVYAELTITGKEAAALAEQEGYGFYRVEVNADRLNVRNAADVNAVCLGQIMKDQVYYVSEGALLGEWVCVDYNGTPGYVSAGFTDVQYVMDAAMTIAEEQAWLEELARQERNRQVAAQIEASASRGGANRGITYISYDDFYLLACVVEMEAGGECYDGKLAVANVIISRYNSRIWGSTFRDVIYSPGQFTGANTGLLASYMASGPSAGSMQAVYDACAGYNNVGGYMFFCSMAKAGTVNSAGGTYIGNAYFYVQR